MDGNGKVVAIVVAIIGALGAIIAALITASGASSTASTGPSPVIPTTAAASKTASPAPAPTAAPKTNQAGAKTCTMSVEDNSLAMVFIDFDACTSAVSGSADADAYFYGGPLVVDDPGYTMYQQAKLYVVKAGTGSYQNCPKGRAMVGRISTDNDLGADEDICVSTSKGAWAVVNIPAESRGMNPMTMNVTLYPKP